MDHPSQDETRPVVPAFTITIDGDVLGEESQQNRELARRIIACFNACDGLSTDELEAGIVQDMRRVINGVAPLLSERRDELTNQVKRESV